MSTNSNQMNPIQHPLRATAEMIGSETQGERRPPRSSHMQGANEGPADVIAKVSGAMKGGKREDDGAYFTNNEGIPFPDPSHSKTVGGLPLASDVFLFQKQQHFNRSKNLESEYYKYRNYYPQSKDTTLQEWCILADPARSGTLNAHRMSQDSRKRISYPR